MCVELELCTYTHNIASQKLEYWSRISPATVHNASTESFRIIALSQYYTTDKQTHARTVHTFICMHTAYEWAFHFFTSLHPIFTNPVDQVESVLVQPPGVLG